MTVTWPAGAGASAASAAVAPARSINAASEPLAMREPIGGVVKRVLPDGT
jgi:hypothetical protein